MIKRFRTWMRARRWEWEMDAPIQGIDPGSNVSRAEQAQMLRQWSGRDRDND